MKFRDEHDSMGVVRVPANALYQAQTQRAVDNFALSELRMPLAFIRAVALIKHAAAHVNCRQGVLARAVAIAIERAVKAICEGRHDDQFPVDVFQTGSGTSTNMNVNEVIASLASKELADSGLSVHPNDQVNRGQSSNDVIPSAIQLAAAVAVKENLLPALELLMAAIDRKGESLAGVVKTGRTHLMDAMPLTLGQELSGWSAQIGANVARLHGLMPRLCALPIGGTAVGTGVNTFPGFGAEVAMELSAMTALPVTVADNLFLGISSQDMAVELSGQLKVLAVSLMKISNDLRWMNSGPLSGLGEIELPALQPGSSIMPGKVNPVIPEAVAMVCAQVMGNDLTITVAGQSGNFQLNVMLPVVAYNLLQSIELLTNACRLLADKAIAEFAVNRARLDESLTRNPILVTALNPVIGYQQAAEIAKRAYKEQRPIIDVAEEMTSLSKAELTAMLDPLALTNSSAGDG